MKLDLRVYVLIDPEHIAGMSPADCAAAAVRGGATLLQIRDKRGHTGNTIELARAVIEHARPKNVPVLINDRVDVALASGADGVHVGDDDMPPADARRLLGPKAIIGRSVKRIEQLGDPRLIDYAAVGGVFVTKSKNNPEPPLGVQGLRAMISEIRKRAPQLPVCAIAGIDHANAASVIEAGADGVSVISVITKAPDPELATRRLRAIVDEALIQRQGKVA
jgi:thiamine-phosphate pyrophosphorylase